MEVTVKGLPVYYEEYGEGTPVLMLHGNPVDHRHMMADLEPVFGQRPGWRRLYLDLPGQGRTPAPDWLNNLDQILDINQCC